MVRARSMPNVPPLRLFLEYFGPNVTLAATAPVAIDPACVKRKNLEGRENDISQAKQNRTSLRIFASLTVI